ncbi:MAG: TRAP transporter large permease [Betaproteobacteria bacterium]|jgi:C4-dicarboxylate transporter DctM subunit|nr:TRAP transporter large permease subunit [Rhodocyclaceae bacterium]MCA3134427.1 TRAP transporter large permease subunit [Rhodocyclaceae bacterium]MCA3142410.1 TRAP transporter large permease subunit [Rhodocyclaceae bacterium]MCA3145008.1 TRAP transporter large permease subunit [Rhodocyclaceae bacterium]MCE2898641.1 TRAP transporter large permease subunit [Betaproteobacteria bacterium]
MTALLILLILALLLATGTPISIALGLTVLVYLAGFSGFSMEMVDIVSQRLFTGLESFALMAIPFFILAGTFLSEGGVSARIIRFATALVGWMPGGMAMAAILACAFFATISGSSPATVAAIGGIMLPAMVKQGYPKRFAVGVITTSGSLGILIPPSIVMIVYAVSTSTSAGKLFVAGVVPGFLLAALLMAVTFVTAKRRGYPTLPRASAREIWTAFREAFWGLLLVAIVMGGIYGGAFTPTEAAAVSAVYAFVAAVFIYRDLRLRDVFRVLLSAANTSAMLLYIVTNAVLFSYLLASEQIPQAMADWVTAKELSPWAFLMAVNLALLLAGQFMEPSSIVLILAPLVLPIATQLGIDPIHLGIIMTVNMEIGMLHPPVGLNLFVASHLARMGLTEVSIACLPWVGLMLLYLVLVTYVPAVSLALPRALGM